MLCSFQNIISEIDQDSNTTLDYREFETYMIRQEERLRQAFDAVDKNKDGKSNRKSITLTWTFLHEYI